MNLHICVQLEVSCLVANGKVALGHLGLGSVKGHLVTGEPALVANDGGSVDGRTSKVKVNITAQVDVLALVGRLDFAALLAVGETDILVYSANPVRTKQAWTLSLKRGIIPFLEVHVLSENESII